MIRYINYMYIYMYSIASNSGRNAAGGPTPFIGLDKNKNCKTNFDKSFVSRSLAVERGCILTRKCPTGGRRI